MPIPAIEGSSIRGPIAVYIQNEWPREEAIDFNESGVLFMYSARIIY